MFRLSLWLLLILASCGAALAQGVGYVGTGSVIMGGTAITNCATSGSVLYNNSNVFACAAGVTAAANTFSIGSSATLNGPDGSTWTSTALTVNSQAVVSGSAHSGELSVTTSDTANNSVVALLLASGLPSGGNSTFINFGQANSSYQAGFLGFKYNSAASATNLVTMGFQGHAPVFEMDGTGNLYALSLQTGAQANAVCYNSSTGVITYNSGVTTCAASIARFKDLKRLITPEEGLSVVMAMQPWDYTPKEGIDQIPAGEQVGLVAEKVALVDLRLVSRDAKTGESTGVRYEQYTAMLTAAIQAQQKQIDELKNRTCVLHWCW